MVTRREYSQHLAFYWLHEDTPSICDLLAAKVVVFAFAVQFLVRKLIELVHIVKIAHVELVRVRFFLLVLLILPLVPVDGHVLGRAAWLPVKPEYEYE